MAGGTTAGAGGGASVPDEVRRLLVTAFGADHVDCATQGHAVEGRRGVIEAGAGEASLLYGELLPEGVSKALRDLGATERGGTVLELGMGTGKVALQAFLQCPAARSVVGVEISAGRYGVAAAAADRLAEACAERFASWEADEAALRGLLHGASAGLPSDVERGRVLEERATGRRLWLLEGDLAAVGDPAGPVQDAQAVFLQIRLPVSARLLAYRLLQRVPDGCRAFCLDNLCWEWILPEPSVLHAVGDGIVLGDRELYSTSWSPEGYPFCVFVADRSRRATITCESAVRAVEDLYSQGYF